MSRNFVCWIIFKVRFLNPKELFYKIYPSSRFKVKYFVNRACFNADKKYSQNSYFVQNNRVFYIPAFRQDGVGIQAVIRICLIFIARKSGATYIHSPFVKLQHQHNDSVGRLVNANEWATRWEQFFNFSNHEYRIEDLVTVFGKRKVEECFVNHIYTNSEFNTFQCNQLTTSAENTISNDNQDQKICIFDLDYFRMNKVHEISFDSNFIQLIQDKFKGGNYIPRENIFCDEYLNISIHIRRGDVWIAYKSNKKMKYGQEIRLLNEEYYVCLLHRLYEMFEGAPKSVYFHIFSDGKPEDFPSFNFKSETKASLPMKSDKYIDNITFYFYQSSMETLYHMIHSSIFIPSKSSFSIVALILRTSYVFYDDLITEFYQFNFIRDYMNNNPNYISINALDDRAPEIIDQLCNSSQSDWLTKAATHISQTISSNSV